MPSQLLFCFSRQGSYKDSPRGEMRAQGVTFSLALVINILLTEYPKTNIPLFKIVFRFPYLEFRNFITLFQIVNYYQTERFVASKEKKSKE